MKFVQYLQKFKILKHCCEPRILDLLEPRLIEQVLEPVGFMMTVKFQGQADLLFQWLLIAG